LTGEAAGRLSRTRTAPVSATSRRRDTCLLQAIVVSAALAATVCGCSSPVSPSAVVVPGFVWPDPPAGRWHGEEARLVSGSPSNWNREDLVLHADGTAEVREYEGPQRGDTGTWDLRGSIVTIDFITFCDRTGSFTGERLTLSCSTGGRSWSLTFARP
jgi:hypothetical protein